ncbi:MAG: RecX family transcriptional regulator [Bacteroidales bacterium]|nr:RecX family transcriptional regulator [Bacteroidales bacterium]
MSLLARAERYCANEEQCRTSVRKKLCDWGASMDASGKIVARLLDQGFIDERRYARAYVSSKLRTQKWGRLKVVYQLRSKQVPPKFITEALAEIPDEEYRNIMLDVANMKWSSYDPGEPATKRRSKLVTFLASRGFEQPEIQTMLTDHFVE